MSDVDKDAVNFGFAAIASDRVLQHHVLHCAIAVDVRDHFVPQETHLLVTLCFFDQRRPRPKLIAAMHDGDAAGEFGEEQPFLQSAVAAANHQ